MAVNPVRHVDLAIRVLLLALAVCLLAGAALVVMKKRPDPMEMPQSALRTQTIDLPRTDGVPGRALVEKPLFWETRRPYIPPDGGVVVENVPQPSGPTVVDEMRLVGIIGDGAENSEAFVNIRGQRRRVMFGEEIEGWELSAITPTEATFRGIGSDGELVERTLTLVSHAAPAADEVDASVRERFAPARETALYDAGADADDGDQDEQQDTQQNNQDQDDSRISDE